jgi:hypothetical protein
VQSGAVDYHAWAAEDMDKFLAVEIPLHMKQQSVAEEQLSKGHYIWLLDGTPVRLIEEFGTFYRVEVLEGLKKGKVLYIEKGYLQSP